MRSEKSGFSFRPPPSLIQSNGTIIYHIIPEPLPTQKAKRIIWDKIPRSKEEEAFPLPPSHDPEQRHHIIYHIIPLYLHKENFMRQKEIPALVLFFFFFPPKIQSCGKPYYKSSNHQIIKSSWTLLSYYLLTYLYKHRHTPTLLPLFPPPSPPADS